MAVAIRAITRIQDGDDAPSLGVGQDGYALTWNNATGAFVATALSAGATDHGALTGLSDDDHTQYALLAGRAGGQTLYGGDAANDDITIHGTSNATRTTSYVLLQPTAGNVGIGTTAPAAPLHVYSSANPGVQIGDGASGYLKIGDAVISKASGSNWTLSSFSPDVDSLRIMGSSSLRYSRVYVASLQSAGLNMDVTSGAGTIRLSSNVGTTIYTTDAAAGVLNVLTVTRDVTSGVGASATGAGLLFQVESSTTTAQDAARVQALWYEATHATRKADLVLTAYDTSEREGLRIRGAGSAPAIGFLGATPQARIAHVADPAGGATVDAEARSAINSILSTLELFGLHAAS